jgi:putative transposase
MHNFLREAWSDASHWLVGRYVILPDHLHLFCSPVVGCDISLERWVAFRKNAVARKWKAAQITENSPHQGDIYERRM